MSKIQAIPDGNGGYIYPVTIANAIIDPATGNPITLGGSDVEYTINNQSADSNGNFTITAASVDAAAASHTHAIADITGLQAELDGKSAADHVHNCVRSVIVGGSTATGDIQIKGAGNITATQNGTTITVTVTPYTADLAQTMYDNKSGAAAFRVFVGTQAEWDSFKSSVSNGQRYIVYIRS